MLIRDSKYQVQLTPPPLNRCMACFDVVSRAGELGLPLLSYRENRVVTL